MEYLENKNMTNDTKDITELKVDVGVLKTQTSVLSQLCEKMDKVIEKLVENQDKHIGQLYQVIDDRRTETDDDISELHERIDNVLKEVQYTERRLMDQIKQLGVEVSNYNKSEKEKLDQLLQWRWMVAGGIIVVSWLITHFSPDIIKNFLR